MKKQFKLEQSIWKNIVGASHKKKQLYKLLLLLLLPAISSGQKPTIKFIADALAKQNIWEYEYFGLHNEPSKQWKLSRQLKELATENDLIELCNHPNGVVRSYAFFLLIENKSDKIFDVLCNHLHDKSEFDISEGCMIDPISVMDFYLQKAGYMKYDSSFGFKLSSEQKHIVDSVLLFSDEIKLRRRGFGMRLYCGVELMNHLQPQGSYHVRLKELAKAGIFEALPPLAKYKDKTDVPIIKSILKQNELLSERHVLKAINIFFDSSYYPILKEQAKIKTTWVGNLSDYSISYLFFKALMQTKSEETRKILKHALSIRENREMVTEILCPLVRRYPDKMWDGLVDCKETK